MSAFTRNVFRTVVKTASGAPAYFETIGAAFDLNTAPDIWCTLEFPQSTSLRVSLGTPACMRETGTAIVHVFARSGKGDEEAMTAAESLRAYFETPYIDSVRMTGTQPPLLMPTDNGEWIDVSVPVGYEWDYVINPPVTP